MCQLFGNTHTGRMSRKQLNTVLKTVNKLMRPSQPDGFGWCVQNADGTRYTERYVNPAQFGGIGVADVVQKALPIVLKRAINIGVTGELGTLGGGLIVHGRTSTNDVGLANTHPFAKAGWVLAHNGIVSWDGEKYPTETTCDTEHILNMFALGKGLAELGNLSGYAACLMLAPNGDYKVFRDSRAPLSFWYSKRLGATVFGTNTTLIRAACAAIRVPCKYVTDVEANVLLTFPADGSEPALEKHNGLKSSWTLGAGARRAFGDDDAPWGGGGWAEDCDFPRGTNKDEFGNTWIWNDRLKRHQRLSEYVAETVPAPDSGCPDEDSFCEAEIKTLFPDGVTFTQVSLALKAGAITQGEATWLIKNQLKLDETPPKKHKTSYDVNIDRLADELRLDVETITKPDVQTLYNNDAIDTLEAIALRRFITNRDVARETKRIHEQTPGNTSDNSNI